MTATVEVAPVTVERLWRTYLSHALVDGECPVCHVRHRCWPWAEARGDLIAYDLLHLGPPAHIKPPQVDDRPHRAAGGVRRI